MTITLGSSTLCASQTRSENGAPVGPDNFTLTDAPGVQERALVGADRVYPEHVSPDKATISFRVTRIFDSPADALAFATSGIFAEDTQGPLKFDNSVRLSNAAVSQRSLSLVGCAVAISYTITG